MLVVDGIELDMFDQLEKVRKLDRRGTLGFQQQGYAGDEIIEQRDMRQHIVADDQVRLPASSFARRSPKNSTRVGTPIFSAAAATVSDGSMPRTGTPMSMKFFSR